MDSTMTDQDMHAGQLTDATGKDSIAAAQYASSQGLSKKVHALNESAHGDTASADQEEEDQQQQQEEEEEAPPLTATVAEGLQSMEERRHQLHGMIDELAQVGLHFLDQQRHQFLRTLESFKEDVDGFCREEVAKGQQLSYSTITAHERLSRAQLLVQSLGGAVCQPGGAGLMG